MKTKLNDELMSKWQIAEFLDVKLRTVQEYWKKGKLPKHVMPGGRKGYTYKSEILKALKLQ